MSDFAYAYFTSELEKLDIDSLEGIFEKVQSLLEKKRQTADAANLEEIERINAIYDKISAEEQLATTKASMTSMWEAVKNDTW